MLGAQQAAATPATESEQLEAQRKISEINAEINTLKAEVASKQSEIETLEKECGIKRQTKLEEITERLQPVKQAVGAVAVVVVKKATELKDKVQARPSSTGADDETPAAVVSVSPDQSEAVEPEAAAAPSSPSPPAEEEAAPIPPATIARNKLQIATLGEEIATINSKIKSKESEVMWLHKKHGIVRSGSLAAFRQTAASKLEVASATAKVGATRAGENARKFFKTASTRLADTSKTVGSTASQKWSELMAKAKGNAPPRNTTAKADGDMTERYSS